MKLHKITKKLFLSTILFSMVSTQTIPWPAATQRNIRITLAVAAIAGVAAVGIGALVV